MRKLTQKEAFEMMDDITVTISDLVDRWVEGDPNDTLSFIEIIRGQLQEEEFLARQAITNDYDIIQSLQD